MAFLCAALCCRSSEPTGSVTGEIQVAAATTGIDIDPDGYTVAEDSGAGQPLTDDGTLTFSQVRPGNHVVVLRGFASNCTVSGADPQTVSVTIGATTQVAFPVTCAAIRGDIQVTVATSGVDLPLDGYIVTVDSEQPHAVSVNESVIVTGLTVGQHRVELDGIAANCSVVAADPISVQVNFGEATPVDFSVNCAAIVSAVHATTLALATWDGSGQVFHPDIVGDRLALTTYPMGNASKELPVWYQRTGSGWSVPAGTANPLWSGATGTYSDPDVVFEPDSGEWWYYYRLATPSQNIIFLARSKDGVQFTTPVVIDSVPAHDLVSPAVVRVAPGEWVMYSVNAGAGCRADTTTVERRHSSDGVNWGPTEVVVLGERTWHLDIAYARGGWWALYVEKAPGTCAPRALRLARSVDGITWVSASGSVLEAGDLEIYRDLVYRSTMAFDGDSVTLIYSGATYTTSGYVWRGATERLSVDSLLRRASAPRPAAVRALLGRLPVRALPDPEPDPR